MILLVPVTPATVGLADARFLGAMHDHALLVNAARGAIVDTGALLAELTAGRLRAALDVTDPEPLPPGHPLWSAPGVLLLIGAAVAVRVTRQFAISASKSIEEDTHMSTTYDCAWLLADPGTQEAQANMPPRRGPSQARH